MVAKLFMRNKYSIRVMVGLLFAFTSQQTFSFPEQCVVSPARTTPCEHLIYKRLISEANSAEREVVCICLQDFNDLIFPSSDPDTLQQQEDKFTVLSRQLNMNKTTLKKLIQY
jgi:hypothetical protein